MKGYEPTLPSISGKGTRALFTQGRLVCFKLKDGGYTTYLEDRYQKRYAWDRLVFLSSGWNASDGNNNLPKPFIIDESNKVLQSGDTIIYVMLSSDLLLVLGSARTPYPHLDDNLNADPTDPNSFEPSQVRNNDNRYWQWKDDGKGGLALYLEGKEGGTGNFGVMVSGKGVNGNFYLKVNGGAYLTKLDKTGKAISSFGVDKDGNYIVDAGGTVTLQKRNGTDVIAKMSMDAQGNFDISGNGKMNITMNGIDLLSVLSDLITETGNIKTMVQGAPVPPSNFANFPLLKAKIDGMRK
jgi:hypothetical protein